MTFFLFFFPYTEFKLLRTKKNLSLYSTLQRGLLFCSKGFQVSWCINSSVAMLVASELIVVLPKPSANDLAGTMHLQ